MVSTSNSNNIGIEPKPYDILAGESYPKKSITFKNNLGVRIAIGQLRSSWSNVNFIIDNYERPTKGVKWLATLMPEDTIQLDFGKPKEIEQ